MLSFRLVASDGGMDEAPRMWVPVRKLRHVYDILINKHDMDGGSWGEVT